MSEILTYEDATQVIRYRCVNQQTKGVEIWAILLLLSVKANLSWGINSLDY